MPVPPKQDKLRTELRLKENEISRFIERINTLDKDNVALRKELELMDSLRQRMAVLTDKLNQLNFLSHEINTFDLDALARVVVEKIPLLVSARYVSLFLYDYKNDELALKKHNHQSDISTKIVLRHHQNSLMGLVLRDKKPVLVRNIDDFERQLGEKLDRTFAFKYATKSCLCVPLMAGNIICGVLNLADKTDGTFFNEMDDLPVIEQLSHLIGAALQNSFLFNEIQQQARMDGLTKLANYKTFYEFLKAEVHRSTRYHHNLCLIMMDVDGFKQVNDQHGHPAGDSLLRQVAQLIASYVRQEDLAARYGGDEFVVILPETPLSGGLIVANRIIEKLRKHRFTYEGATLDIRVSMGIADLQEGMVVTDLVKKADGAMYQAKAKGKNRLEAAT
ncbi:MAG: diguanylate cyclase [Planctomycetota bacterium]|nr:diguanylate cyclase [Planctomycetota bacterium]